MRRLPLRPEQMPTDAETKFGLPKESEHYVKDVLRMQVGDAIEVFDGEGVAWHCVIVQLEPGVRLMAKTLVDRGVESPLAITLYQAIPKGDRWEWILEKATELGVARIVPVETHRTVVTIPGSKVERKLERWRRIIESAARQSTRTVTPELTEPRGFVDALRTSDSEQILYCHPGRNAAPADDLGSIDLWIGPEGGFTGEELESFGSRGARPFGLGPRVLRVETATVASLALLQSNWGDMS